MIREANISDVNTVRDLILNLSVTRHSSSRSGFVEYPIPSEDELARKIEGNHFFYVAEADKRFAGFYSNYASNQLASKVFSKDPIVSHLLAERHYPFIYSDLLGVKREFEGMGIGARLIKRMFEDVNRSIYRDVFGAVSHSPFRNDVSICLLDKLGFKLESEIKLDNGLVFGIYHNKLGKPGS